jgi:hypothetical protein
MRIALKNIKTEKDCLNFSKQIYIWSMYSEIKYEIDTKINSFFRIFFCSQILTKYQSFLLSSILRKRRYDPLNLLSQYVFCPLTLEREFEVPWKSFLQYSLQHLFNPCSTCDSQPARTFHLYLNNENNFSQAQLTCVLLFTKTHSYMIRLCPVHHHAVQQNKR